MRTTTRMVALLATLCGVIAWSDRGERVSFKSVCAANDEHMTELLVYLRHFVSSTKPGLQVSRDSARIPTIDPARVQPVRQNTVCARAARLINRELHRPDSTSRVVYVVRIGSRYWAEDPTYHAGEYIQGFVVDSTVTTILSRNGR